MRTDEEARAAACERSRKWQEDRRPEPDALAGVLCPCGCGEDVGVYQRTNVTLGQVAGQPRGWRKGHHQRKHRTPEALAEAKKQWGRDFTAACGTCNTSKRHESLLLYLLRRNP